MMGPHGGITIAVVLILDAIFVAPFRRLRRRPR